MDKFTKKTVLLFLNHSLAVIALTVLLTLAALFFLPRITFDTSVEALFDKESKSYLDFQQWWEVFGSDDIIIVAFEADDIFSYDELLTISRLTESFEALPHVDRVTSLTNVNSITGFEQDFIVEPFIEQIPRESEALEELKERALGYPLYVKRLISEDAKATAIAIEIMNRAGPDNRNETVREVQHILDNEPGERTFHLSGITAVDSFWVSYMERDLKLFLSLSLLIIALVLVLSFRSLAGLLMPLTVILVTFIWTMFIFHSLGFSINNITTIIPAVLLVIALAASVHFMSGLIRETSKAHPSPDKRSIITRTVNSLIKPCALASFTTAAGFFSLTVSTVPSIREVGIVVGTGAILAFFITFGLMPLMAEKFYRPRIREASGGGAWETVLKAIGDFNRRHSTFVLAATAIMLAASFWGLFRIRVDTNVFEYFKKDGPVYQAVDFIGDRIAGVYFLNISLKATEADLFKEPHILRKMDQLQEHLESLDEVDKTVSVVDYLKEINKSFHNEESAYYAIPASKRLVSQYTLLYGADEMNDHVDPLWQWTTIQVRINDYATSSVRRVIEESDHFLDTHFPAEVSWDLLGWPVLDKEINSRITRGQLQSLTLAMVMIFGVMFLVFRSIPLGLISIIPNAFPILVNFGIMGLLGIRLDTPTSMIAAVGIGLIVDDSIHFVHGFKEQFSKDRDHIQAMRRTLLEKGKPIILTSLLLFFGFGVTAFSQFMPIVYFGVLSALIMIYAVLADLFILPCLLISFKPRIGSGKLKKLGKEKK